MFLVIEHFFRGRVPNTRHAAFFFGSGVSGKVARYWQERRRRRFGDIRRSVIRIVGEVGRSRKKKSIRTPRSTGAKVVGEKISAEAELIDSNFADSLVFADFG